MYLSILGNSCGEDRVEMREIRAMAEPPLHIEVFKPGAGNQAVERIYSVLEIRLQLGIVNKSVCDGIKNFNKTTKQHELAKNVPHLGLLGRVSLLRYTGTL